MAILIYILKHEPNSPNLVAEKGKEVDNKLESLGKGMDCLTIGPKPIVV